MILCGGAINSPQLLQLSGVGNAAELAGARRPRRARPARRRREPPGPPRGLRPVRSARSRSPMQPALKKWKRPLIGAQWLFLRSGPGATNHFEAGGFVRSNDDVAYPNLMFHFLPLAIRYDGTAPKGGHGYQVHVGPMYSDARGTVKITSPTRASIPRSASTTSRPRRTGASGSRRFASRGGSSTSRRSSRSTAARPRPGRRSRRTSRSSTGSPATARRRCTRPAPAGWAPTSSPSSTRTTMRVHGLDGLRVVDASVFPYVHEREHLRAGDDGRGEGRRPDPRRHAAAAGRGRSSTATTPSGRTRPGADPGGRRRTPRPSGLPRMGAGPPVPTLRA